MPSRKNTTLDIEQRLLIDAIYYKYHFDFRGYAQASLKRRLQAALIHFGCKTISQLQDRVLHERETFPALLEYLTVQVSAMFRDPSYFRSLREQVVPLLRTYPSLKLWVAGCSAGEEVYSLAILLREEGLLERSLIYATDINPSALKKAEAGVYDIALMPASTENHAQSGRAARCQTITAPPMGGWSLTSRCVGTWFSQTTAWPQTAFFQRCTWCPVATC